MEIEDRPHIEFSVLFPCGLCGRANCDGCPHYKEERRTPNYDIQPHNVDGKPHGVGQRSG